MVFDFQPKDPENILVALEVISGKAVPGKPYVLPEISSSHSLIAELTYRYGNMIIYEIFLTKSNPKRRRTLRPV